MRTEDETTPPADAGPVEQRVMRPARKPLKVPKYTMAPSLDWTEQSGLRRAIAVLKTEAAVLKREGFKLQPAALLRVAAALSEANRRGSTTGEGLRAGLGSARCGGGSKC